MTDSLPFGAGLDLAAFISLGWDRHASEPRAVADALSERAETLPADADGAAAIGLAEHVWLSHLHDAPGLADWLRTVPAAMDDAPEAGAALAKARWAVAQLVPLAGPAPEIAAAARARALQNVWAHRVAQGRAADALAALNDEWPAALADPDTARCRGLAATCNNLAADLRDGRRGDPACDSLMLAAAETSKVLWSRVGTWVHAERAEYQLARCHAALGHGAQALAHARATHAALHANGQAPEADDFEWFYAWEALAWAGAAAADEPTMVEARKRMQSRLAAVSDAELRGWCEQSLAEFDARPR
jgi:hypothetical protein